MAGALLTVASIFLLCGLGAEGVITIVDRFTPSSGLIHPNFAADTIIAVVDCTSDDPTAAVTVTFSTTATSGSPVVNDIHEEEDNQMPGRFYIEATITGVGADVLSVMITCLENGANGQSITKSINIQATIQVPYFTMFQQEQFIQSTTPANTQLFQIEAMIHANAFTPRYSISPLTSGYPFTVDAQNFLATTGPVTRGTTYDVLVEATSDAGLPSYKKVTITVESVSAPQNVAVSTSDGCASATVTWDAPASSNVAIQGYTITYRSYQSDGTLLATNTMSGISSTARSATITNLPTADYHEFEVAAVTPAGTGDPSTALRLDCPVTTQPPTTQAPTTAPPDAAFSSQPLVGMILLLLMTILLLNI